MTSLASAPKVQSYREESGALHIPILKIGSFDAYVVSINRLAAVLMITPSLSQC